MIDATWLWAIAAVLIALAELHAPGFYLIWIALGAAATAVVTFFFAPAPEQQGIIFAAADLVACGIGYFVYRQIHKVPPDTTLNRRDQSLLGAAGTVEIPIKDGQGKVRLGDTLWLADGPDLPQGTPVKVTGLRGTTLLVEEAKT